MPSSVCRECAEEVAGRSCGIGRKDLLALPPIARQDSLTIVQSEQYLTHKTESEEVSAECSGRPVIDKPESIVATHFVDGRQVHRDSCEWDPQYPLAAGHIYLKIWA